MRYIILALSIFMAVSICRATSPTMEIRYPKPFTQEDLRSRYFVELLQQALERTRGEYGEFKLIPSKRVMKQSRAVRMLEVGEEIDVMWSMTSLKRESQLRAIYFPTLKGLLGHRVFLISGERQPVFDKIRTLDELKKLRGIQGHDWPDTTILKDSGLNIFAGTNYNNMFTLVSIGRIDYFPRGVTEIYAELEGHPEQDLAIESQLLLRYPAPHYFFVYKENSLLAERIAHGLELMRKDGSFDRLFYSSPDIALALKKLKLQKRRTFDLENLLLSEKSQQLLGQKELWKIAPVQP
ncbi:substrate-binding periplasmic protein [Dongshaea marina]|uniref:substrate-binding periplasmic protein n=1 Tax=Dongshaea marina TaxID=2047966 RepID=UPI000D3E150D|nr:hypothetical protein [Dongshaea marina]